MDRKAFGDRGERLAAQYLTAKGYRILKTNYRTRIGEIDIIALTEGLLVFVEVKSRKTRTYGRGFEAVNAKKQQTLRRVGEQYLVYHQRNGNKDFSVRFDVIDIFFTPPQPIIEHIENAF